MLITSSGCSHVTVNVSGGGNGDGLPSDLQAFASIGDAMAAGLVSGDYFKLSLNNIGETQGIVVQIPA